MNGLTKLQASECLKRYGKNVLKATTKNPWWKILGRQFTDLLVIILIVAAGISHGMGEHVDANVILGIVLLNASIGFFQEYRTEKTLQALKKMIHPEITVIRDGEEQMLPTEFLVPGDWVVLREGDKIPADGSLIRANVFRADEAALTGESVPVDKLAKDLVFMGTVVSHGSAIMEVKKTGMGTRFGEIAKLTTETDDQKSPLQIELEYIGIFVTKVTAVLCIFLFGVGVWRGESMLESLLFSVSVAIAAVPEGLPTTITVALALGATILTRRRAVVKRLSSVETLGAVTTICSDKTGTLTKNEMTVREVYLADRSIFEVTGVGYDPHVGGINFLGGRKGTKENTKLLYQLIEIGWKCNDSKLIKKQGVHKILGDPTEGALLTLAEKYMFSRESHCEGDNCLAPTDLSEFFGADVDEVFPFDSHRKMMSVISGNQLLTKGSPDHVLEKCTHWTDGKKIYPMTKEKLKKIHAHYERMAEKALRVLAFARKPLKQIDDRTNVEALESKLIYVGLVGMIDPPRSEVALAVSQCKAAGIRVIVITGDYGVTASAVAKELGIIKRDNVIVLTGKETRKISDTKLKKLLGDIKTSVIFARSLPDQKMRIVSLLQEMGEVVAMTGDGVNDAPALKKANIGVAMGITGTEVSKEAATMILMNDSFASIVTAIEEGRRIYENLKKFVWFIFSCNIGELVVVFSAILFQFPLPLTAVLILCVDLGTDILPAIALGVDPAEEGIMSQKPRDPKLKVLNKKFVLDFFILGIAVGGAVTMAFLYTVLNDGWKWGMSTMGEYHHAMTVAFTSLVFVQLVNAFSSRSYSRSIFCQNPFSNIFLVIAILSSVALVMSMIYIPFLNDILKTAPLTFADWGVVGVASLVPLLVVELRKWVVRGSEI